MTRRLGDACVRHVPGAQVRSWCGWTPRITEAEVAARNRRARFPATRRDGVLRIASAPDLARPPQHPQFNPTDSDERIHSDPCPGVSALIVSRGLRNLR